MSLSKLRALIHLANNSNEPGEAESAALQACRYIKQHGVELTVPSEPKERPSTLKGEGWEQLRCLEQQECSSCGEPIEHGELYWHQPRQLYQRHPQRLHGGCV